MFSFKNKKRQAKIIKLIDNLSQCSGEEKAQTIHSIQMLHALELFDIKDYSGSMKEFIKLNIDPADVIKLLPELDSKPGSGNHKKLKGRDLENAIIALIGYLVELKSKICEKSLNSSDINIASNQNNITVLGKGSLEVYDEEETLTQRNKNIALEDSKPHKTSGASSSKNETAGQRNIAQQLELIDTALLKCYLQTNHGSVEKLLRQNNCNLEEAERTLLQYGKYNELIILYQMKGQHIKALQLLREKAKQPDSSLNGYHCTKNYLQNLGAEHLNLIFQFSDWILKDHPEEGLKIFTEDRVEVENLPRLKILEFLSREHDSLVIPYLEHVIHEWGDNTSDLHDKLISMYREKITNKNREATEKELQHIKLKLVTFLEKSSYYTPEQVILHFPNDTLFEERAIILGKLGKHDQALAIYVLILGDVEQAIRYCENISNKINNGYADVYVILMKILLNPEQNIIITGLSSNVPRHPKSTEPDLETALSILEKHANKISPLRALSILPDSVPLNRLKYFLTNTHEDQLILKRSTQVLKGLLYAEHTQLQDLKRFHESKSILVTELNVCAVCKKRFGKQSALLRYPNGDIVHYSCRI